MGVGPTARAADRLTGFCCKIFHHVVNGWLGDIIDDSQGVYSGRPRCGVTTYLQTSPSKRSGTPGLAEEIYPSGYSKQNHRSIPRQCPDPEGGGCSVQP